MASQKEANILQQNWERDQRALARAQRNQTPEPNPPPPPPAEQEEETPSEPGDAVEVVLQLLEELPPFEGEEDHLTLRTESETGEDVLLFPLTNSPPTPAGGDYFSRPLHNTPDTTGFRNRVPPSSGNRAFLANLFLNPPSSSSSSSSSSSGNNTPQRPTPEASHSNGPKHRVCSWPSHLSLMEVCLPIPPGDGPWVST